MKNIEAEVKEYLAQTPKPAEAAQGVAPPAFASPGLPSAPVDPMEQEVTGYLKDLKSEQTYGTTGQQLITALEGAASAATFGLSTKVETALGVKPEDIQARREENPVAYGLGQAGGLAAGMALPVGGALGLASKAGTGIAKGIGLTGTSGLARVGNAAVREAVESALITSGDEVSKMFASNADPAESVDTALANVGLSALLGGGFGAAIGSVSPLWNATFGKNVAADLSDLSNRANYGTEISNAKQLADAAEQSLETKQPMTQMLSNELQMMKPNIEEIEAAAKSLGIDDLPIGLKSSKAIIQKVDTELAKKANFSGIEIEKKYQNVFKKTQKAALDSLSDASKLSKAESGEIIGEGLVKQLKQTESALSAQYQKLDKVLGDIEITPDLKKGFVDELSAHEYAQFGGEATGIISKAAKAIDEKVHNLKSWRSYRSYVNDEIEKAMSSRGPELSVLLKQKELLNKMRDQAIELASVNTGIGAKEGKQIAASSILELKQVDKAWSEFKQLIQQLGTEASIGKVGSTRQLLKKLENLPFESLTKRTFDVEDIKQLRFFGQKFPEQFKEIKAAFKKQLKDKFTDLDGNFNTRAYLKKIETMGPEAKEILFDEKQLVDLASAKTIVANIPKDVNPSGTASAMNLFSLGNPFWWTEAATDAAIYSVLYSLPKLVKKLNVSNKAAAITALNFLKSEGDISPSAFKAAADYTEQVLKGERFIDKSVRGVFEATEALLPSKLIPDDEKLDKLDKRIQKLQEGSGALLDTGGETSRYLPNQGMVFGKTAATAAGYLNSLRPAVQKKTLFDSDFKIDKMSQRKFKEALIIAESPMSVLPKVKEGTITNEDLTHLKTLYPALYRRMSQKLVAGIEDALNKGKSVPYKTRIGVSTFLGEPLDSTLTPDFIQKTQAQMSMQPQQQEQPMAPKGKHSSMQGMEKLATSSLTSAQARQVARSNPKA